VPDTVIRIENLRYAWPGAVAPCLDIAAFEVLQGERIFLHGPSGSGKSTLLGLLGGVLTPRHGTLKVLGRDLAALDAPSRDRFRGGHIGFVFQQFNLLPYLPVLDNVLLPCRFSARRRARALAGGNSLAGEAARLLAHLDLDAGLHRCSAARLSVGQQQRVAVARALIGRPELIVADEPTSALDGERQAAFLDLLGRECAASGSTLLFVSHDRRLAAGFDREIALSAINRAVEAGAR
jgi:putative ABC transport system ATP-binding protein